MGFGSSIRNALGRKRANLSDEKARHEEIQAVINQVKEKQAAGKGGDHASLMKPLLQLAQEIEACGEEPLELYIRALKHFHSSPVLKDATEARLQHTNRLKEDLLPFFVEHLKRDTFNIALWTRVIDDYQFYGNNEKSARMKMLYIINIGEHFQDGKESTWFDLETESVAEKKLQIFVDEFLGNFEDKWAKIDLAEDFSDALARIRPDDMRTAMIVAVITASNKEISPMVLPLIEEAMNIEPDRIALKRYYGLGLAKFHLEDNGRDAFDFLMECMKADHEDVEVIDTLMEIRSKVDISTDQRLELMKTASELRRDDLKLRIEYAKDAARLNPEGKDTLLLISESMGYAANDPEIKQLQAQVLIHQQNPVQAIAILERQYLAGDMSDGTLSALADCYSLVGRRDERARDVYRKSLKIGHGTKDILTMVGEFLLEKDTSDKDINTFEMMIKKHKTGMIEPWKIMLILKKQPLERLKGLIEYSRNKPDDKVIASQIGRALAAEVTRTTVRMVLALPPKLSLQAMEVAHDQNPDALILTTQLAKMKLDQGIRTQETEELLSDICRRDSAEIDMRFERAKMAYEMENWKKALALFRELLNRSGTNGSSLATGESNAREREKETLLSYIIDIIPRIDEPDDDDLDFYYRNMQARDIDPEAVLTAAQHCLDNGLFHPGQQVLLEKALVYFPDDKTVHRNVAIVRLTNNNARAFAEMCDIGFTDDELKSAWSILSARLHTLRKKESDFQLTKETGTAMAQSLDSLPDYKRTEWQDVIAEFCAR